MRPSGILSLNDMNTFFKKKILTGSTSHRSDTAGYKIATASKFTMLACVHLAFACNRHRAQQIDGRLVASGVMLGLH